MIPYRYVKKIQKVGSKPKNLFLRFFSILLIIIGLGLFASATYPVFSYQVFIMPHFQSTFLTPLPETTNLADRQVVNKSQDLTLVSDWFPAAPEQIKVSSKITHYTISIPRLKIFEAAVEIGGKDLKNNLVQYGGTALPGEFGNTVIFGHSVLPQFFNPKNYMTIFSTLPTLKENDQILIDFDGIEYKYKVYQMAEVSPDDVTILEQQYDNSYLTLVTCVPPGTLWKRLAVKARLEKI